MKNQNLYELSFGVNSDPILAQGQFSVLVLRLVPVMVPDVFAQNLQPMVQVSANQPQKWNWSQLEPDNTGKHTYSLVSLRK
jgi:hypothetical protein